MGEIAIPSSPPSPPGTTPGGRPTETGLAPSAMCRTSLVAQGDQGGAIGEEGQSPGQGQPGRDGLRRRRDGCGRGGRRSRAGLAVEAGSEVLVNRGAAAVGNVTRSSPLVQLVVATATAISAVHQTRVFM